ncbi:hypothetical protein L7H23_05970 [Sphingopyxis sp. BSN-002]|uniref:hypothetical protein n=1 Tax=Sphingopyxis sp. BSN-002 TaxID=2911495 RepID=UPI001EDC918A|nr:hypothetical protein [Sphingopyxis sp. BSN-002]UKK85652.1 hypothetical protein L7H23_05970 [Sphingopyxis sp. BSN-002]
MTNKPAIPASTAPAPAPANDSVRRLQIGIAGVLTVLLLVGMAGLIGDRARENAAQDAAAAQAAASGDPAKAGSAPLEELGVQPVSKDQNAATDIKAQQAAPAAPSAPASTVPDLEPDPALARARQSKQ